MKVVRDSRSQSGRVMVRRRKVGLDSAAHFSISWSMFINGWGGRVFFGVAKYKIDRMVYSRSVDNSVDVLFRRVPEHVSPQ